MWKKKRVASLIDDIIRCSAVSEADDGGCTRHVAHAYIRCTITPPFRALAASLVCGDAARNTSIGALHVRC